MDLRHDNLFKSFIQNRELQPSTITRYLSHLTLYSKFVNKSPTDFIAEAEAEEDERIRLRNRKVKEYLLDFKDYLTKEDYSIHTRSSALTTIRSFYTEYSIELPRMRFKKNLPKEDIDDIPDKEDIKLALKIANTKYKAIILLMISSGMRSSDIRSLKYSDLLTSLKDYVKLPEKNQLNIDVLINTLPSNESNLIVPTWKFISQKTNQPTITFSTPESLDAILYYLKTEPPKTIDEPLFHSNLYKNKPISRRGITQYFAKINRNCAFESRGRQGYFKSHNLRKFFATTLYRKELQQLTIDWLLSHKIDPVTSSYFKLHVQSLKEQYITVIPSLSIEDTTVHTLKSPEFSKVMRDMELLKRQVKMLQKHEESE
jgi:integrase